MIKYRNKFNEVDLNKSYKIILKPIVTEKATKLSEFNKVVFEVASKSNKNEIKHAIEKLFSVRVKSVNIINIKGKVKKCNDFELISGEEEINEIEKVHTKIRKPN